MLPSRPSTKDGPLDKIVAIMVTRIGSSRPYRHFLKEWRNSKGLTQQDLADRLDTTKGQISRWENNSRVLTMDVQVALADALGIDPAALFRDPATPSADELLRNATPEQRRQAFTVIEALLRSAS